MWVLPKNKPVIAVFTIILLGIILAGCRFAKIKTPERQPVVEEQKPPSEEEKPIVKESKTRITLYFGDKDAEHLVSEVREIAKTEAIAKAAIIELIKGPQESNHFRTIPMGTKLISVSIKNEVAFVNFSRELVSNHPGGSAGETMTIYSVVNTLTQISAIEKVQFLAEGKKIETIAGHYDTTQPFERREDLMKENSKIKMQNAK